MRVKKKNKNSAGIYLVLIDKYLMQKRKKISFNLICNMIKQVREKSSILYSSGQHIDL